MNVLILSNCQGRPLAHAWKAMRPEDRVSRAYIPEFDVDSTLASRFLEVAKRADLLLYIPVSEDYPASFVRKSNISVLPTPVKIRIPCLFFPALHPDLVYIKLDEGGCLSGPMSDYHSLAVARSFLQGLPVAEALENLRNAAAIDQAEVETGVDESLRNLYQRESECDVSVSDLINQDFRKHLLFYSINHPTNTLIVGLLERVFRLLGLTHAKLMPAALLPTMACGPVWPIDQILADTMRLQYSGWNFFRNGEAVMSQKDFSMRSYATYRYHLPKLLSSDIAKNTDRVDIRVSDDPEQFASCREGKQIFRAIFRREIQKVSAKAFSRGVLARATPLGLWPSP